MAFKLPTFNLVANVWHGSTVIPPVRSPDLSPVCNLTPGRRMLLKAPPATTAPGYMQLLLPFGTDVRSTIYGGVADTVECPAGSGRFYTVDWIDNSGTGFANQHVVALLLQAGTWSPPTPPPPTTWFDDFLDITGTGVPPHVAVTPVGGTYNAYIGILQINSNTLAAATYGTGLVVANEAWSSFNPGARPANVTINFFFPNVLLPTTSILFFTRYDGSPPASANGFIVSVSVTTIAIQKVTAGVVGSPTSTTYAGAGGSAYTLAIADNGTNLSAAIASNNVSVNDVSFNTNTECAIGIGNTGPLVDPTGCTSLTCS